MTNSETYLPEEVSEILLWVIKQAEQDINSSDVRNALILFKISITELIEKCKEIKEWLSNELTHSWTLLPERLNFIPWLASIDYIKKFFWYKYLSSDLLPLEWSMLQLSPEEIDVIEQYNELVWKVLDKLDKLNS